MGKRKDAIAKKTKEKTENRDTLKKKAPIVSAGVWGSILGSYGGLITGNLKNVPLAALMGGLTGSGLKLRETAKKKEKKKKGLGTAMVAAVPVVAAAKLLKPGARMSTLRDTARSSGGAHPFEGGYTYRGRFRPPQIPFNKSATFSKIATSLSQIVKSIPKPKKIGSDAETIAVGVNKSMADKVVTKVVQKLRGDEELTRRLSRMQPRVRADQGGDFSYQRVRTIKGKGALSNDPTVHGIEMAADASRDTDKVMSNFKGLIDFAGKKTKEQGGILTGFAHIPDHIVRGSGVRGGGFLSGMQSNVAGGHIHVDKPAHERLGDVAAMIKQDTRQALSGGKHRIGHDEMRRRIQSVPKARAEDPRTSAGIITAGGLGSVLAHLGAPGSRGRALYGGSYGTKPISQEFRPKYPLKDRPADVQTVELRSAPTFLADPDLAKVTLDTTKLVTENPESYRLAKDFMSKAENYGITPKTLHSDSKAKNRFLNALEDIYYKAGVTSDAALDRVFRRVAENKTFADEGSDILQSWKNVK